MFSEGQWVRNKKDRSTGYVDFVARHPVSKYKVYYVQDKEGNPLKGNPYDWAYESELEAIPSVVIYTPAAEKALIDLALLTRDIVWYAQLTKFNAIEA